MSLEMAENELFAKPTGCCTFNSALRTANGDIVAKATYRRFRDTGALLLPNSSTKYRVKHTCFSRYWKLLPVTRSTAEVEPLIVAHKLPTYGLHGVFGPTVELTMGDEKFRMSCLLLSDYQFDIKRVVRPEDKPIGEPGEKKIGKISLTSTVPDRYTVTYADDAPFELFVFCFWMVNMLHRRDMQNWQQVLP